MIVGPADVLQNTLFAAMVFLWFGVAIFLFFRLRSKQRDYLKEFPPVEGVPLDMYSGGGPRSVLSAIFDAMWQWQDDPALERKRREVWRRYRLIVMWAFGFPAICSGLVALAIATGFVRFR